MSTNVVLQGKWRNTKRGQKLMDGTPNSPYENDPALIARIAALEAKLGDEKAVK